MPRWRLFYHVVWATRGRRPAIDGEGPRTVERSIRATCHAYRAIVHAVGVMPDHVHLAVSIPPSVAVSTLVGRIKGPSSHLLNHQSGPDAPEPFAWQAEYGVLSFGERNLPDVVAYIENQETRHAANHLSDALEPPADPPSQAQPPEGLREFSAGSSAPRTPPRRPTPRPTPNPIPPAPSPAIATTAERAGSL